MASSSSPSAAKEPSVVILNAANIGFTYGRQYLHLSNTFDWRGVLAAWRYYKERQVEHCWFTANESLLRHNPGMPAELINSLCSAAVHDGMKDADDLLTIRAAKVYSAQFVDNDNYRDWRFRLAERDDDTKKWWKENDKEKHVYYTFMPTGEFMPDKSAPPPEGAMDIDDSFDDQDGKGNDSATVPNPFGPAGDHQLEGQHDASAAAHNVYVPHVVKKFGGKTAGPCRSSKFAHGKQQRYSQCPAAPYARPGGANAQSNAYRAVPPSVNSTARSTGREEAWEDGAIRLGSFYVDNSPPTPMPKQPRNCRGRSKPGNAPSRLAPSQQRAAPPVPARDRPQPVWGGGPALSGCTEESWDDNTFGLGGTAWRSIFSYSSTNAMDVDFFDTVGGDLDPTTVAARCLSKLINDRRGSEFITFTPCSFPSTAWLGDLPAGCIREAPSGQSLYRANDIVRGRDLLEALSFFLGEGPILPKDAAFSAYLDVEFGRCLDYILWGSDAVFEGFTRQVYAATVGNFLLRNFMYTSSSVRAARAKRSGIANMSMCVERLERVLDCLSRWALSLDYGYLLDDTEHCHENGASNGGMNGDSTYPSKLVISKAFGYLAVLLSIPLPRVDRRLKILLQDQRWQGLFDFCRKVESRVSVFDSGRNFLNETIDIPDHKSWFEVWGFGVKAAERDRSDSHDSSSAEPQGYPDDEPHAEDYEEPAMWWQRAAFAGVAGTIILGYIVTGWNPPFEVQVS
ncbi:hypothetical protein FOZ62_014942 [Perkinsus olseni]|uniref:Uncharacterized protein n=1 Tax=Perkinsus olseni TaxID=32597 RepID=A0A7J6T9W6_PEROL|nr:hypothetical protein FOZ62_014942 [Perkinsus olseni]